MKVTDSCCSRAPLTFVKAWIPSAFLFAVIPFVLPGGSVYVFLNSSRTRMKLLHWERGGYVIFYKRMEHGRISPTVFHDTGKALFMHYRWDAYTG